MGEIQHRQWAMPWCAVNCLAEMGPVAWESSEHGARSPGTCPEPKLLLPAGHVPQPPCASLSLHDGVGTPALFPAVLQRRGDTRYDEPLKSSRWCALVGPSRVLPSSSHLMFSSIWEQMRLASGGSSWCSNSLLNSAHRCHM